MADMDFVEGVGESSSPPRSFAGFCAVHDVRNDVYTRLVECGHEEAVSNPQFRENLDAHFNRLPPSYGLDVNMEKVEDVLLHQKLLSLAKDPEKCPVYHIRFLERKKTEDGALLQTASNGHWWHLEGRNDILLVKYNPPQPLHLLEWPIQNEFRMCLYGFIAIWLHSTEESQMHISTKSDGNDDHVFLDSILLSGSSNEAADRRLPLSHKRTRGNIIDFEPCSKLEDLNLDVRKNSKAMDRRAGNIAHVLVHEVIFSTIDKPKLLSQLSALLSDIGLNIREAHVFSTSDGYSLDVFVVDGWPVKETDGLYEAMEKAVARYEGSWSGSSHSHPAVKKTLDAQEKSADWEIDRRLLKIGERIASGSCGDLYHGFYLGQDVAVKILRSEDLNDDLEEEFNQEVAILRKVQHKNVVRFIGACTNSPHLCIVTEYMPGGSLYDYLHKNHCVLKLSQLLKFAIDVCEGMEYLHLNNIIHRDLKTANLLMDTQHVVKVADFGVARYQSQGVMTAETGTYRWMAPEVINHLPYDQKADIFSFAIVLWELVTAKVPYDSMTPLQAALGVRQGLRPDLPKNVHPKLLDLMQRCWDAEPINRPPFTEIKVELENLLEEVEMCTKYEENCAAVNGS